MKIDNSLEKGLGQSVHTKGNPMVNEYMKRCSASFVIEKFKQKAPEVYNTM